VSLLDGPEPHWVWLALGLLLAVGEMTIPGVFLIWMAGAALITGLVTWLIPLDLPWQVLLFAVLSIVAVFAGRNWLRGHPVEAADPMMNHRGARSVRQRWSGAAGRTPALSGCPCTRSSHFAH
jgi:inner membrane protein